MSGSERFQTQHLTVLIALVEGSELLNEGNRAVAFKTFVSVATKKKKTKPNWISRLIFSTGETEYDC